MPSTAPDIRAVSSIVKSPSGQLFFKHFGESIFRNDLCNADVDLGDLLIHEGPQWRRSVMRPRCLGPTRHILCLTVPVLPTKSLRTQSCAAAIWSSSIATIINRCTKARGPGRRHPDLFAYGTQFVRHDRRRRLGCVGRRVSQGADSERTPLVKDPERSRAERPFRLACIQLATYDGTIYNVRKVMEKIGTLCDYVLWDEAWIGYNAFHPLFGDHSPMRIEALGPNMPGLFSTQSVHKQGQASRKRHNPQTRRAHPGTEALCRA